MQETPIDIVALRAKHDPLHNFNEDFIGALKGIDRLAVTITERVGTLGFFIFILVWTVLWLGWNMLASPELQFDPPMGFVLWLFISNVIQLLLMPLIMVGQNIQGRYAEARADHDFKINVQAEKKIELVLHHLEYQNGVLNQLIAQQERKNQPLL